MEGVRIRMVFSQDGRRVVFKLHGTILGSGRVVDGCLTEDAVLKGLYPEAKSFIFDARGKGIAHYRFPISKPEGVTKICLRKKKRVRQTSLEEQKRALDIMVHNYVNHPERLPNPPL